LLNTTSPEHNWALVSGQTLVSLDATDGETEFVRLLETEQMSCGSHNTTISRNLCSPLVFSVGDFPAANSAYHCIFLSLTSFICLRQQN